MKKETTIKNGWTAFIKDNETCVGYREFKDGGKYFGNLELVTKPTEEELKAELKARKIALPK
jgi:hypothetical protein